jgi:hypothetical protein
MGHLRGLTACPRVNQIHSVGEVGRRKRMEEGERPEGKV